jgi:hypothetical protein
MRMENAGKCWKMQNLFTTKNTEYTKIEKFTKSINAF